VNRCLSEGRRTFLERVAGIEAGAECERLEPLLSALADGEADADELAALRPHLKTCLTCRARLREYRAAPARVAALVPPALVAGSGGDGPGALRSLVESIVGATQDKAAALGERAHAAAELATGQKLAAVAASAAALAGGGAGVERLANARGEHHDRPAPHGKTGHQEPPPSR
jgi:anti-sigma factor RsiW